MVDMNSIDGVDGTSLKVVDRIVPHMLGVIYA